MAHICNPLFEYTSGRWIINDAIRHAERRRVFNVNGLRRLAAESVNRSPDDIVDFKKLAEGGFNRAFLITMHDGFQMVARIPYPITVPKYFAVASEVATMDLLRSSGLPIPEIYGYSPSPDNAAETEYIFMEFVKGTCLSDLWFDLTEEEIISISRQLAELESKMMSITFPAGGSLYYTKDLEKAARRPGIPLKDERFCVGPDTRLFLWYGRRSQLDVDRGPYLSPEAALIRGAEKEIAYLKQFGRPLFPLQRVRRQCYQYEKQLPSAHIENLERYLLIAPSIIPKDPALYQFRIRHPDLQPGNIFVSRSTDSSLHIVGLVDWQHTSILPMFLLIGIPNKIQNYDDPITKSMIHPSLPDNLDNLNKVQQSKEKELYRRRLVHYHYVISTVAYNKPHFAALNNPVEMLRRRLFCYSSEPWEGETLELKIALMGASKNWEIVTGRDSPCPVVYDTEDVRKTLKLDDEIKETDEFLEKCQDCFGFASGGWVPPERYEEAVRRSKKLKEAMLAAAESEKERAEITAHWPLDDMDEEEYM